MHFKFSGKTSATLFFSVPTELAGALPECTALPGPCGGGEAGALRRWVYLACLPWRLRVENESLAARHCQAWAAFWLSRLTFSQRNDDVSNDNSELIIHVERSSGPTPHAPLTGCHINVHSWLPLGRWITLIRHRVKFSGDRFNLKHNALVSDSEWLCRLH